MSDIEIIKHFFEKLLQHPAIKLVVGFFIGIIKLMSGPVERPAYGIVIMLWLVDTVTGYYHAWKNPAIIPESRRMYHGLIKLCVYYFLLFFGYQCSLVVLTAFLQGIIEGAILFTEGSSILENIKKITDLHGTEIPVLKIVIGWFNGKMHEMEAKRDES